MLPKKNRLTTSEFYYSSSPLHRLTLQLVTISIKQRSALSTRVVIQVPKRLDKRSVVRNRIKRMIQEVVRPLLSIVEKQDVLIKANRIFTSEQRKELEREIAHILLDNNK